MPPPSLIGHPLLSSAPQVASASQRAAIEAAPGALLVLAGPGAGKTYCLIERIRFLIEQRGFDPARVCAFTFTNKAAGEIAERLAHLGSRAERVQRGTIHAFCTRMLRELGGEVGLETGFGIADEEYQLGVLRRLEGHRRWHRRTLTRFSAHRFRGDRLLADDAALFDGYERFLARQRLVDFDTLIVKAAELLALPCAAAVRERWDVVLIDEFQDLNPVQYRVIHELARDHRHVFAVGDHDQSIYSWAGADRSVFTRFMNDFGLTTKLHLDENHRCPREVFALAQRLVTRNAPIFDDRVTAVARRESPFGVMARRFDSDADETAWLIDDVQGDRTTHGHDWGDIAILYRKHEIGDALEGAFLNAGIPCRLAQGRALADDPIVAYVLAALRLIANPSDEVHRNALFALLLPRSLFDEARARAEASGQTIRRRLNEMLRRLPRADPAARHIRRALFVWRNLTALGRRHTSVSALIQELLSQRVGRVRSVLEDRADELTDPAAYPDVLRLADALRDAREVGRPVWLPRLGGAEIAVRAILTGVGIARVEVGGEPSPGALVVGAEATPALGIALGVFKAGQLLEIGEFTAVSCDFTAVDIETTSRDPSSAEIVEMAAVRVRNGQIVDAIESLVRPSRPIPAAATEIHGILDSEVASAPRFEDLWPRFRAFCGDDIIVAHNGYEYDFRILARVVKQMGKRFDLCTYDTLPLARDLYPTSRRLPDLAKMFAVDTGRSHRALDDARSLAQVFVKLDCAKVARARKTALVNLLDQLGVALALSDEAALCEEATLLRTLTRPFAVGRYSSCLESYEREAAGDESVPTVDELIDRLGGAKLMIRIRAEKTAEERYPVAMVRLRRLLAELPEGPLEAQLCALLERAALSKLDGEEPRRGRVNLLTLHSTKGLEFSRVYIVGAEDVQLPGVSIDGPTEAEIEEARRLLYVGMTRTEQRLVLTCVRSRGGKPAGGHRLIDEMGLTIG